MKLLGSSGSSFPAAAHGRMPPLLAILGLGCFTQVDRSVPLVKAIAANGNVDRNTNVQCMFITTDRGPAREFALRIDGLGSGRKTIRI